jgi:hypothetical protein
MDKGFTGTRYGMLLKQANALLDQATREQWTVFRHGACKGSDEQAVIMVAFVLPKCRIIAYPGKSAKGGDNEWLSDEALRLSHEVRDPKTHFARNRDIVNESASITGTPRDRVRQSHGGTWYTLGYSAKRKPTTVIWPDGREERIGVNFLSA